jgi:hypothetical protein
MVGLEREALGPALDLRPVLGEPALEPALEIGADRLGGGIGEREIEQAHEPGADALRPLRLAAPQAILEDRGELAPERIVVLDERGELQAELLQQLVMDCLQMRDQKVALAFDLVGKPLAVAADRIGACEPARDGELGTVVA